MSRDWIDPETYRHQTGAHVLVHFWDDNLPTEKPTVTVSFRDGIPEQVAGPDSGRGVPLAHLRGTLKSLERYLRGECDFVALGDDELRSTGRDVGALMVLAGIVRDPRR